MDCSLPCSSVHGIFQARVLEWGAVSSSRGSSPPRIRLTCPELQADLLPLSPWGALHPPPTFLTSRGLCTHQSHLYLHICMSLSSLTSLSKSPSPFAYKDTSHCIQSPKSDIILLGAGERSPKWRWLKDKAGESPRKENRGRSKGGPRTE